ncbi:MAG: hypothetical protein ACJ75E_02070 [Actinomycetes bacterium]
MGRDPLRALPGRPHAFAIIDLVSRKWLVTLLSAEETSTQVEVVFGDALQAEGLLELVAARQDGRVDLAKTTRPAAAAGGVRQRPPDDLRVDPRVPGVVLDRPALRPSPHPDRPGPDRVVLRPPQGRVAHLEHLRDPDELRAELEVVPSHDTTVRLHAGIG